MRAKARARSLSGIPLGAIESACIPDRIEPAAQLLVEAGLLVILQQSSVNA